MRYFLLLIFFACANFSIAQTVTTSPAVPDPSQPVTITFNVTGTDFAAKNLNDVWLWAWLEKGATDVNAPTNVNPATSAQNAAKVTRSQANPNLYSITLTATTFFNRPASEIAQVGVLLKGQDWSNGQTADKFINFAQGFTIAFSQPTKTSFFVNNGESINISTGTNQAAQINIKVNNAVVASSAGAVTEFSHSHIVTETSGSSTVTAEATANSQTVSKSFVYVVRTPTVSAPRPAGIIDGINYGANTSQVTLCLWAPGKSSIYVLGDFNDWNIHSDYQMKKDGERFWLTISGLTQQQEYGFQYLVDESVRIADPYADKILDPDDQNIPSTTYPNLKAYPSKALNPEWYYNRVGVLQTGQQPYPWVVSNFEKPAPDKLVIYELLIRDFFGSAERNYQNLIDTLGYIKSLGITAIQLMPVMEFNGNESWGYNPTFMFAPDKYYGTKNKFKEFIDKAHQLGIAVILDIAMNHHDMPNPYVMMDFDFVNSKPTASNKWFNVNATHPFNVFFDMNHESAYTKRYLDTVNHYWLNEFKVDGYRFDLSKGFTQTNNPNNVGAWSGYDASRIAIIKRMADKIWAHSPDAYIILEHFGENAEEKELAEYRAGEGKGMMLWGKMTEPFNQLTMGYAENADITGILHESRGWTVPHLIGFMESHDEERLMVKNVLYGNQNTNYSAKDELTALTRMRAANTLFLTLPGPKMIWQFGELGYDYSINHCPDGSNNEGCRVSPKPVTWEYYDEEHRAWLYSHVADLNRLRASYDVFTSGTATVTAGSGLVKQVVVKNNPYNASPSNADQMNAVVVANFELTEKSVSVQFPHTGTWFDYYASSEPLTVSGAAVTMTLQPGAFKLFTDVAIESEVVTGVADEKSIHLYPNPTQDHLFIAGVDTVKEIKLISMDGRVMTLLKEGESWNISQAAPGLYVVRIVTSRGIKTTKLIKRN